ncbi:MAG: polysaccharide deacetylase family protein [Leptospirales bacterium]|nr:polysaccharide deacetylase family protein [Leptospirales bacterium]
MARDEYDTSAQARSKNWTRSQRFLVWLGVLLSFSYIAANQPRLSANLRKVPDADQFVFLTFDAHPCKKTGPHSCDSDAVLSGAWQLLDTLRKHNVKCTLFFTAEFIEAYPDLVRRAIADGHEIGSHLKTHTHPLEFGKRGRKFSKEWFMDELLSADRALQRTRNGRAVKLFRMPYGLSSYFVIPEGPKKILQWAQEAGYTHVDWTIDTLDWISKTQPRSQFLPSYLTSNQMADRIYHTRGQGAIVLSHLTRYRPMSEPSVNEMLPGLLTRLATSRVRTARISDFLVATAVPPPEKPPLKPPVKPPLRPPLKPTPTPTAPPEANLVELKASQCNYSWNFKRVHICLQGISKADCDALEDSFLSREELCPCTQKGVSHDVENLGEIVQISCKM